MSGGEGPLDGGDGGAISGRRQWRTVYFFGFLALRPSKVQSDDVVYFKKITTLKTAALGD